MISFTAKTAFRDFQGHGGELARLFARKPAHRERIYFGDPRIDMALPWEGLPKAALHEVASPPASALSLFSSAAGFAAALLGRASAPNGVAVWCQNRRWSRKLGQVYGPGSAVFGLDPNRLLMVTTQSDEETLWVMEECLRSTAVEAVLGEVGELDLTASRRLQLAAEKSGSLALLLRLPEKTPGNNAALTRWHIAPLAGHSDLEGQTSRWQIDLWRCRGGAPGQWEISWKNEAFYCHMATEMADRLPTETRRRG